MTSLDYFAPLSAAELATILERPGSFTSEDPRDTQSREPQNPGILSADSLLASAMSPPLAASADLDFSEQPQGDHDTTVVTFVSHEGEVLFHNKMAENLECDLPEEASLTTMSLSDVQETSSNLRTSLDLVERRNEFLLRLPSSKYDPAILVAKIAKRKRRAKVEGRPRTGLQNTKKGNRRDNINRKAESGICTYAGCSKATEAQEFRRCITHRKFESLKMKRARSLRELKDAFINWRHEHPEENAHEKMQEATAIVAELDRAYVAESAKLGVTTQTGEVELW